VDGWPLMTLNSRAASARRDRSREANGAERRSGLAATAASRCAREGLSFWTAASLRLRLRGPEATGLHDELRVAPQERRRFEEDLEGVDRAPG
jgi:hypothetical protein